MTEAYKCDACNDFAEGRPAVDFEINAVMREDIGTVILPDGLRAEWSHVDERISLCPSCAVPVIEWVDDYTETKER